MRTVGHLILMAVICVAMFIMFMAIRPARAWSDVWRPMPWGWQCCPYGPARIPACSKKVGCIFGPPPWAEHFPPGALSRRTAEQAGGDLASRGHWHAEATRR